MPSTDRSVRNRSKGGRVSLAVARTLLSTAFVGVWMSTAYVGAVQCLGVWISRGLPGDTIHIQMNHHELDNGLDLQHGCILTYINCLRDRQLHQHCTHCSGHGHRMLWCTEKARLLIENGSEAHSKPMQSLAVARAPLSGHAS